MNSKVYKEINIGPLATKVYKETTQGSIKHKGLQRDNSWECQTQRCTKRQYRGALNTKVYKEITLGSVRHKGVRGDRLSNS